jgi:hypothetical protein
MKELSLLIVLHLCALPTAVASDESSFRLQATKNEKGSANARKTGMVSGSAGWLVGRARRVLVTKAADEGAWKLWKLDAMENILGAYNERNEQFGRPVGCTKFRITVRRSGLKTAKFEAQVLEQHGNPKVAECFLKALEAMEDKDLHYPSLMYGRTYRFVFDVCANGHPR